MTQELKRVDVYKETWDGKTFNTNLVFDYQAKFIKFGLACYHYDNTPVQVSAVIIEKLDGQLATVPIHLVKFCKANIDNHVFLL